jgi:hypothetical protein
MSNETIAPKTPAEQREFDARVAAEVRRIRAQGYVETPSGRLTIPVELRAKTARPPR